MIDVVGLGVSVRDLVDPEHKTIESPQKWHGDSAQKKVSQTLLHVKPFRYVDGSILLCRQSLTGLLYNLFYEITMTQKWCYNRTMTKIAIIEDDAVINQMYRMKFEADGFDVQVADNGKTGIALVETFQPDIILLDLQMPEMTGEEALSHIRLKDWGKKIPVIILTNLGVEESPKTLRDLNISNYIVKAELTPSQVVARVKDTLHIS